MAAYYAEDYRDDYGDPSTAERHRLDAEEAALRLERLRPFLGPDVRLLEVGAGSGAFLDSARPNVGEIAAVEPDDEARDFIARQLGIDVAHDLGELDDSVDRFQLVVGFHVLEHLQDPVEFLRRLHGLTRPGGRVIMEVPNIDDALIAVYGTPAITNFYYQKAHLWYFSAVTLERVFVAAGMRVEIEGVQRYDLSNHLHWLRVGEPGGQGYYGTLISPEASAAYAESLQTAGRTDTLWATGHA